MHDDEVQLYAFDVLMLRQTLGPLLTFAYAELL
jgi:hypothetical protein